MRGKEEEEEEEEEKEPRVVTVSEMGNNSFVTISNEY